MLMQEPRLLLFSLQAAVSIKNNISRLMLPAPGSGIAVTDDVTCYGE